jgi:hypothetical protein
MVHGNLNCKNVNLDKYGNVELSNYGNLNQLFETYAIRNDGDTLSMIGDDLFRTMK